MNMKKVLKIVGSCLLGLAIPIGFFGGGYYYATTRIEPETEVQFVEKEKIIQLPGEVQKRVVTKDEVESKIMEIGELSTYQGNYTVSKAVNEDRYMEKVKIPLTQNQISISASGIVKVGYDISDISVIVDDDFKIYISYPHAKLLDNYVVWDTVECSENNNILNPIEFSQYQELVAEIEEEGLADVEAQGIYDQADEHLKTILNAFLGEFVDYEIIYM